MDAYKIYFDGDGPENMEIVAVGSLLDFLSGIETLDYCEKIKSGEIKTENDAVEMLETDGHYIEKTTIYERRTK